MCAFKWVTNAAWCLTAAASAGRAEGGSSAAVCPFPDRCLSALLPAPRLPRLRHALLHGRLPREDAG